MSVATAVGPWSALGSFVVAASLVLTLGVAPAVAQDRDPSGDAAREEARAHFERAVVLMGHENWEAALVELTRSLELFPTRSALFNAAMCQKALYRYGASALLFRRWLTEYGEAAPAEERERVETAYAEVRSLLGNLSVSVSLDGAEIRVDGRGVGRSPLSGPLELAVGPHVVEALLDGYRTARHEATVVAGQDAVAVLTLVPGPPEPTQDTAGTIVVRTVVPEARVEIDGAPADLAERVAAGRRRVRVSRPGFEPFETEVVVEPGGTVEVEATLTLAAALDPDASGFLRVTIDGEAGDVRLNGAPLPQLVATGLVVPAGPHVVEVLREGYLPWRRRVEVAAGAHETVRALPWPTPETLEAYERDARAWSIAGWSTLGAGVALAGGGGGLLGWAVSLDDDLQAGIADWCTRVGAAADCDPWGNQSAFTIYSGGYEDRDRLQSDRDRAAGVEVGGWVLVGLGAAAVVTGTVLLLTGDDPDYYRERAEPGVSTAGLAPCAGGAVFTFGGRF